MYEICRHLIKRIWSFWKAMIKQPTLSSSSPLLLAHSNHQELYLLLQWIEMWITPPTYLRHNVCTLICAGRSCITNNVRTSSSSTLRVSTTTGCTQLGFVIVSISYSILCGFIALWTNEVSVGREIDICGSLNMYFSLYNCWVWVPNNVRNPFYHWHGCSWAGNIWTQGHIAYAWLVIPGNTKEYNSKQKHGSRNVRYNAKHYSTEVRGYRVDFSFDKPDVAFSVSVVKQTKVIQGNSFYYNSDLIYECRITFFTQEHQTLAERQYCMKNCFLQILLSFCSTFNSHLSRVESILWPFGQIVLMMHCM